jgi:hypothetical protein
MGHAARLHPRPIADQVTNGRCSGLQSPARIAEDRMFDESTVGLSGPAFRLTRSLTVVLRAMEIHHNTIDKNNRPASFGTDNGNPWIEFADGMLGRTVIYGYTVKLRQRIRDEIITRGIQIPDEDYFWFREESSGGIPCMELSRPPASQTLRSNGPTPPIPCINAALLSRGQEEALKTLLPYAALATNGLAATFCMIPRTATLIAGPSGTGKTRIVTELAERLKLPLWTMNMSGWLVQGSRGDSPTIHNLYEWVDANARGIIFLDEIEKIGGSSDWFSAVRLEVHDVCDGRLPYSFRSGSYSAEALFDYPDECNIVVQEPDRIAEADERIRKDGEGRRALERKLKTHFFIVAAGAWQSEWEESTGPIGFGSERTQSRKSIDRKDMIKAIAPEILNRFRSEIVFLEPMLEDDYFAVATLLMERLPPHLMPWFAQLCVTEIPNAMEHQLGMRIFEELLAKAWVEQFMDGVAATIATSEETHDFI